MNVEIEQEYSVMAEQYAFELIRISNHKEWLLKLKDECEDENSVTPTVKEIFEIISNIFNNIDENIVNDICIYIDGEEQWVTRGTTEIQFYQQIFGDMRC